MENHILPIVGERPALPGAQWDLQVTLVRTDTKKEKHLWGHAGAYLRFSWIVWITSEKKHYPHLGALLRLSCEMVWKDVSQLTHKGTAVQEWRRHSLRNRISSTRASNRRWHSLNRPEHSRMELWGSECRGQAWAPASSFYLLSRKYITFYLVSQKFCLPWGKKSQLTQ